MDVQEIDEQPADTVEELPRLYELQIRDQVDDILSTTVDYAAEGAEEGTLVWARAQTGARARNGCNWHSPPGGLHCGLVLRPGLERNRLFELALVGQIALGCAIADRVSPMTELRYRWPDAILISRARVAGLGLAIAPAAGSPSDAIEPEWAALAVNVNVLTAPPELGYDAASLCVDGDARVDAEGLLVGFARQFLWWINRWADEGLAPVQRAWLQRPAGLDEPRRLELADESLEGTLRELGPAGEAVFETADGRSRTVSLAEFFAAATHSRDSQHREMS